MSGRLETLKKARERMIEDRDTHAKVLAARARRARSMDYAPAEPSWF